MVKITYEGLQFSHLVAYEDNTVFAAARDSYTGHIKLFLINESNGNVYVRNGRIGAWEELVDSDRTSIIARFIAARNRHIPLYRANGTNTPVYGG
jgi:hypothetical protein